MCIFSAEAMHTQINSIDNLKLVDRFAMYIFSLNFGYISRFGMVLNNIKTIIQNIFSDLKLYHVMKIGFLKR